MTMINYKIISEAIDFYDLYGYTYIEAPWLVSEQISNITRPNFAAQYVVNKEFPDKSNDHKRKAFVASGEQSFLYLMAKGYLPVGKYMTVTPCIRNEMFDETHCKYFMKLELINHIGFYDVFDSDVNDIMDTAYEFFCSQVKDKSRLKVVKTDIGFDINLDDIEIGSYGKRTSTIGNWIYGTGLAEPRFSRVLFKAKEK